MDHAPQVYIPTSLFKAFDNVLFVSDADVREHFYALEDAVLLTIDQLKIMLQAAGTQL